MKFLLFQPNLMKKLNITIDHHCIAYFNHLYTEKMLRSMINRFLVFEQSELGFSHDNLINKTLDGTYVHDLFLTYYFDSDGKVRQITSL